MDQITFVRDRLTAASKTRGLIVRIAKDTGIDQRTVRAVLDETRSPHVTTLEKLEAYFKKSNRKAKP